MSSNNFLNSVIAQNQLTLQGLNNLQGNPTMGLTDQSIQNNTLGLYETDYYAGNQIMIFLGDLWLEDVTMIQFQLHQNKRPFYGYKSQQWNTVATGTQLVEGVFSINYTHTNYLNMAIAYYLSKNGPSAGAQVNSSTGNISVTDVQNYIQQLRNNPTMIQNLSPSPSGNPVIGSTATDFANLNFTDKANMLESYLWGASDSKSPMADQVISPDNLPGFDIVISFGNYPQDRPGGAPDEVTSSHTTSIINDVRITGRSIQSYVTGEPQQEVYTFIARGVDHPLTKNALKLTKPGAVSNAGANAVKTQ